MATKPDPGEKLIASNKKAFHDYFILQKAEAGLALTGTEVKSLRDGKANIKDSYVLFKDGEAFLFNAHISPYSHGNLQNHEAERNRKLLLHRREIEKLIGKTKESGLSLVPLSMYFKDGKVKVEIALARGKKAYDKRQSLAKRDAQRDISKAMGRALKGRFTD